MAPLRLFALLAALLGVWLSLTGDAHAQPLWRPGELAEPFRYDAATGHTIQPPMAETYDRFGGEPIVGRPLTEVFTDTNGLRVQYFENARFELRPGPDGATEVLSIPLGRLLTRERTGPAFAPRVATPTNSATRFVPETRHSIGGAFRTFWERNGGAATFGNPISEELEEPSREGGAPQVVQWFERARFVFRPDAPSAEQVQLSPLGRAYADIRVPSAQRAAVPPIAKLGEGRFAFSPSSPAGQNILLALAHLNGAALAPGQALSFNAAIGEVSARSGFVPAGMIVGGAITDGVGGGICQVASALYVAAMRAGLAIEARRGHSLLVRFAEATPGMEAAVAWPDLDLVIRNDTAFSIIVAADAQGSILRVALWGQSDGRTTIIGAPVINDVQKLPDSWVFDPALEPGAIKRVSGGNTGMVVQVAREVLAADGQLLARTVTYTRYAPSAAVYRYGPDVVPPGAVAATSTVSGQ